MQKSTKNISNVKEAKVKVIKYEIYRNTRCIIIKNNINHNI